MKPIPPGGLRYLNECITDAPELEQYLATMTGRLANHGDAPRWEAALGEIRNLGLPVDGIDLGAKVSVSGTISAEQSSALRTSLSALKPWRKGPFQLFDIELDTEWRSDWKWQRLAPHLPDLKNATILDIGCGNGYYGWRMLEAGATQVIGVDPTLLFMYQYLATSSLIAPPDDNPGKEHRRNIVLPLKFEELSNERSFDLVFSMGVLYHRRDPLAHLQALAQQLTPGGCVVLETLVSLEGDITPRDRYAQMRNVHCIPTPERVISWLRAAGLRTDAPCDVTTTTTEEQRTTQWMSFESLSNTLDPADHTRTIEGYPAPVRACFVAESC